MSNFQDIPEKFNFSENEEVILKYWKDIDAFNTSLKLSEGRPEFTFYDGPPFATGLPHYGHILAGTIKDTVTRYAHQTGHYVSRRFGWDCHGLPVEYEIDKKLGITGRDMVLEMGVANYNSECRSIVQRYTAEWEETVTRLGRWIDFRNDYKTMDPSFMESVWWVFKTMFDKGLVYRGYKVMPYSTACGTPLSNFEAGLNYKDVNDPAVVVSFPLINDPEVSLLAWTTTPWTLPSNLALCVNSSFDYVKIQDKTRNNKIFIILEKRLSQLFPEINKPDCTDERKDELYTILERLKGSQLVGLKYTPLFDYFINQPNAFRVVADNYVTEDGGTGIVHQAPAFGEDDYRVCLSNNIIGKGEDLPCPVDANGRYTDQVPEYVGRAVKDADNDISQALKAKGRLVLKEVYFHSYPFCWRSDTPLIYKAVPSWFVSVEKVKPQLLNNNTQTYWVPSFVQEKRFHNWLADAKDWAISRNRFWGTPIPLWISDDLEEMVAIGSVDELYQLSGVKVTDLHKEYVDNITIPSKQGKGLLRRVDEVFDCWFESGSMPYAQLHYPFENQDRFNNGYPADFIAEGLDQTRGWFYTLMVISTCLFNKPAFKNLIVNGLVLAADGKKMSKRLKNYPDPKLILKNCGADALRLYLINSPVVRAEVLKFQEEGVSDIIREVNAWDMTLSNEFDKMCVLKVQPNFKDLGKRLGKDMKNVAKAITELTHNQIVDFMNTGSINILGYDLNTEHLVVKKEFNGDNKKYEAGISDDGRLLVAIDTTCDDEVLEELKARAIASGIQKLRKSGGLVMTDRIEIFYEELNSSTSTSNSLIAKAVAKHANATIKRVKTLPLPLELKSKHAIVIAKETINDSDISKSPFSLVLTQPIVAVNSNLVKQLIESTSVSSSTISIDITVESAVSYIQTMDYDKVIGLDSIYLVIDDIKFTVVKNVHYFSSTLDLLLKGNDDILKQKYPYLPSVDSLVEEGQEEDEQEETITYYTNYNELRNPIHRNDLGRETLALHNVFGVDSSRRGNLNFIEQDVIVYISGNAVIFENIGYNKDKRFLLSLDDGGIGCVAIHPSKKIFAVGGLGYHPRIFIYEYPSMNIIKVLKDGTEKGYANMSFNRTGLQLASIGHIRFWKIASTFTGMKLQGDIGKFGKVELSDISSFIELPDGKVLSGTENGETNEVINTSTNEEPSISTNLTIDLSSNPNSNSNKQVATSTTKAIKGPSNNQIRRELRQQRLINLSNHNDIKPKENEDDLRDINAIIEAEKTLGDYKLKSSDKYEITPDKISNINKKLNTDALKKVAQLTEEKMKLSKYLNESAPTAADELLPIDDLKEKEDRKRMITYIQLQAREIESLRAEITMLKRKDAPPLTIPTMPHPPGSRLVAEDLVLPPIHDAKSRGKSNK
eukprot:gene17859-23472_t